MSSHPFVPLQAYVRYWDDHYFAWLPEHRIYESFELMTVRGHSGATLAWAFFTERAGDKHQVHYFSDESTANRQGGQYAHMRIAGQPFENDRARTIRLEFSDVRRDPVVFEAQFAQSGIAMRKAGLTDQSGHSKASLALYFYRDRETATASASLDIAGQPVTLSLSNAYKVAYSQIVYAAVIPFGTFTPSASEAVRGTNGVTRVTFRDDDGHAFECRFDRAVGPEQSATTAFAFSFDDHRDICTGYVRVQPDDDGATLHYFPTAPQWSAQYPFSVRWRKRWADVIVERMRLAT